jgi:DNA (cytosine-5)-methyltransferase 1
LRTAEETKTIPKETVCVFVRRGEGFYGVKYLLREGLKEESMVYAQETFDGEIIVDNFAGGGGASTGIEIATGRLVALAVNHDPAAILMHRTNHPYTEHFQASVWDIDPKAVCRGRPVGLAWFSPDCKHFSKAKGAALVDRKIRGLAWITLRWAATVRPRVIILENVEEFQTWGPVRKGKPVKKLAGTTFRKFIDQLTELGYTVEYRELIAADYGAPTSRKRFYLVARCDGKPIVWPKPTHSKTGADGLPKWRSAAEIIDWSLPCPSVFASKAEIMERYGLKAVRPLAKNTMRRVIRGVDKFTIRSGKPFIVPTGYGERKGQAPRVHDMDAPVPTVVGTGKENLCRPLLAPVTVTNTSNSVGGTVGAPVHTVTTAGNQMLVTPSLVSIGQTGGGDRIRDLREPVPTTVSKKEACLVSPSLIQYHTEQTEHVRASGLGTPINTVDASNRYGLTCANLVEYYTGGRPLDVQDPLHTVTSHDREAVVAAHIAKYYGGVVGEKVGEPLPTVTAIDHNAVCAAHVVKFKGDEVGTQPTEPLPTQTSSGVFAVCRAHLAKIRSGDDLGHWPLIRDLLNEFCGYTLAEDDVLLLEIGGALYYIADIGLRMLSPRELYNAMGFPPDYIIDRDYLGNEYKKSAQVARCGNAVCPPVASALVRANLPEWCNVTITTMAQLMDCVAV